MGNIFNAVRSLIVSTFTSIVLVFSPHPTHSLSQQNVYSPSPTPSESTVIVTPSPTPTSMTCNSTCSTDSQCQSVKSNYVCYKSACRLATKVDDTTCTQETNTPQNSPPADAQVTCAFAHCGTKMLTPNQCDVARCCPIGSSYVFTDSLKACQSIQLETAKRNAQPTPTTNTIPQTTQGSGASSRVPRSYDEFMQRTKDFIVKAKAQGESEGDISRDIEFMYRMTQDQIRMDQNASSTKPHGDQCPAEIAKYSACLSEYNAKLIQYNSCLAGNNGGMMCIQPLSVSNCYKPVECGQF